MISHPCCHRRTAMGSLVRLLAGHTAMRPTDIEEAHCQPTHPAVRAPGCETRQGLADFALVAKPTSASLPLHHTRGGLRVPSQRQHLLQTGCAVDRSDCNTIHPPPVGGCFHVPLGQPLAPADHWTTPPTCGGVPTDRIPPTAPTRRWERPQCTSPAGAVDEDDRGRLARQPVSDERSVCPRSRTPRMGCPRPRRYDPTGHRPHHAPQPSNVFLVVTDSVDRPKWG
jgi:hypothetical protein